MISAEAPAAKEFAASGPAYILIFVFEAGVDRTSESLCGFSLSFYLGTTVQQRICLLLG